MTVLLLMRVKSLRLRYFTGKTRRFAENAHGTRVALVNLSPLLWIGWRWFINPDSVRLSCGSETSVYDSSRHPTISETVDVAGHWAGDGGCLLLFQPPLHRTD
jgi:hypothetical protein